MRDNVVKQSTDARKQYKYDYDRRVRETLVFEPYELIFVGRASHAAKLNYSKTAVKRHTKG